MEEKKDKVKWLLGLISRPRPEDLDEEIDELLRTLGLMEHWRDEEENEIARAGFYDEASQTIEEFAKSRVYRGKFLELSMRELILIKLFILLEGLDPEWVISECRKALAKATVYRPEDN